MIYIKRLFNLIVGLPLLVIIVVFAALELLSFPIKMVISYIICGDITRYDTWFGWAALPIAKLLQKMDLIDKDVKFE